MTKVGLLEAILTAIADQDAEIGGTFITQMVGPGALGDTSIVVASTVGWQPAGSLLIGGQLYNYTGITPGPSTNSTITGLTPALIGVVNDTTLVADATRARSAIDQLRRAMLVNYASADDLSTVGRNLGVLRDPFISDDEKFRAIIKALAYNPRGTVYGLEQALNALIEPGGYEIIEDLIDTPATVQVVIEASALLIDSKVSEGKSYLNDVSDPELPLTTTTVTVPDGTRNLQSVRLAPYLPGPISFWGHVGVTDVYQRPSTVNYADPPSVIPAPLWIWEGTNDEGTIVPINFGTGCLFWNNGSATALAPDYYKSADAHIQPDSIVDFSINMFVLGAPIIETDPSHHQFFIAIDDGVDSYWLNLNGATISPNTYSFGIWAGGLLSSAYTFKESGGGTQIKVHFRKVGQKYVEFFVNNVLQQRVAIPGAGKGSSMGKGVYFGIIPPSGSSINTFMSNIELAVTNPIDYVCFQDTAGVTAAATPTFLTASSAVFQVTDVGAIVTITQSAAVGGGNSNGPWVITSVDSGVQVELEGVVHTADAFTDSLHPTRITSTTNGFRYPDDLGKTITIDGPNAGTYVITDLLDSLGSSLTGYPTDYTIPATSAVIGSASFVSSTGVTWNFEAVFPDDSAVAFHIGGLTSVTGTTGTLRQALPDTTTPVVVTTTNVLTGQVQRDDTVMITREPDGTLSGYAFYVPDPFSYLATYLDGLLAAGIVPVITIQ